MATSRTRLSEETRGAILAAAEKLIVERGRLDVPQLDIARAAGVSRQTVFHAFGSRTGMLVALVRHLDATRPFVPKLAALSRGTRDDPAVLFEYLDLYVAYIPCVYPIGALLEAAAHRDPGARQALDDRLKGGLLTGFYAILKRLKAASHVRQGWTGPRAAEFLWSLVQFGAWKYLVLECGWSPEEFRRSRHAAARLVLTDAAGSAQQRLP